MFLLVFHETTFQSWPNSGNHLDGICVSSKHRSASSGRNLSLAFLPLRSQQLGTPKPLECMAGLRDCAQVPRGTAFNLSKRYVGCCPCVLKMLNKGLSETQIFFAFCDCFACSPETEGHPGTSTDKGVRGPTKRLRFSFWFCFNITKEGVPASKTPPSRGMMRIAKGGPWCLVCVTPQKTSGICKFYCHLDPPPKQLW